MVPWTVDRVFEVLAQLEGKVVHAERGRVVVCEADGHDECSRLLQRSIEVIRADKRANHADLMRRMILRAHGAAPPDRDTTRIARQLVSKLNAESWSSRRPEPAHV